MTVFSYESERPTCGTGRVMIRLNGMFLKFNNFVCSRNDYILYVEQSQLIGFGKFTTFETSMCLHSSLGNHQFYFIYLFF